MSNVTTVVADKAKTRPSVSPKCLLNIRSIVTQNIAMNSNQKAAHLASSKLIPPPLPLADPLVTSRFNINQHRDDSKDVDEHKKQLTSNENIPKESDAISDLIISLNRQSITKNVRDEIKVEHENSQLKSIDISHLSVDKQEQDKSSNKGIGDCVNTTLFKVQESNTHIHPSKQQFNSSQCTSQAPEHFNVNEPSNIPPLPIDSSVYHFDPLPSSYRSKSLATFSNEPSNRLHGNHFKTKHEIIESSSTSNDSASNDNSMHYCSSVSMEKFGSTSPSISNTGEDESDDVSFKKSLIIVNSALNRSFSPASSMSTSRNKVAMKSRRSERTEKEILNLQNSTMNNNISYYDPSTSYPASYTRFPFALRSSNPPFNCPSQSGTTTRSLPPMNASMIRRQFPKFETVRTPTQNIFRTKQEYQSLIPMEFVDCCQTENISLTEDITTPLHNSIYRASEKHLTTIEANLNKVESRSNHIFNVTKIREIMNNACERLTKNNNLSAKLPLADTHCHFDLIFDRLRIKQNNLKKYFDDFNEYYPPGFAFELAIQVFWRPKQLTEDNWTNWYSRYLDDERVYASCGVHPHWSTAWNDTCIEDIERCLKHPKVVAIGEIGLDFGPKNTCLINQQRRAFEAQLILAAKWSKPVVIHSREAYEPTFSLMKQYLQHDHKIHLHCFVGTIDDVNLFTSYFTEIKFGFTPIITRSKFLHETIQQLELTQILSETDSPYFIPNELSSCVRCAHPGMVYGVIEAIAQIRHLSVEDVAHQLRKNARHIYGV